MEIVFNERNQVEEILKNKIKTPSLRVTWLIVLLAKYYYENYKEDKTIKNYYSKIKETLSEIKMENWEYKEYEYIDRIKNICKRMKNGDIENKLKEINEISITKDEMTIIQKGNNEKEQKVLFTMFVLAKSLLKPSGWINYPRKDIFIKADVRMTNKEKSMLIHSLYKNGLIELNPVVDKDGYKVNLSDDQNNNIEFTITKFDHIGNQYLQKYKQGWKMCENCGRMIKIKSNEGRPQKYCKKCGEEINRKKTKEHMQTLRKK